MLEDAFFFLCKLGNLFVSLDPPVHFVKCCNRRFDRRFVSETSARSLADVSSATDPAQSGHVVPLWHVSLRTVSAFYCSSMDRLIHCALLCAGCRTDV